MQCVTRTQGPNHLQNVFLFTTCDIPLDNFRKHRGTNSDGNIYSVPLPFHQHQTTVCPAHSDLLLRQQNQPTFPQFIIVPPTSPWITISPTRCPRNTANLPFPLTKQAHHVHFASQISRLTSHKMPQPAFSVLTRRFLFTPP